MSKYDVLAAFFLNQPEDRSQIELSFEQIKAVLGFSLPRTARVDRVWWGNARNYPPSSIWLSSGWKVTGADLAREFVTFRRIDDAIEGARQAGRYERLSGFLGDIMQEQSQIALAFAEIGRITGSDLPKSALTDRTWWANMGNAPWVVAGWTVENVFLRAQIVVLRRAGENLLREIPHQVRLLLENSSASMHVDASRLLKWIGFCRRVGWHFEATVLYEKGCLDAESLSSAERAELEECYEVSKRALTRYKRADIGAA
ncbi:MAG: hypothetical protein NT018_08000 [Armatimonadetes bacterium]|nr:hypothetical protein [Armatimonadota bacterium]